MKKVLIFIAISLLSLNSAYALQLTSDENGSVKVSEPQLNVGDMAPQVALVTSNFKKKEIGGATGKVQIISTIESFNTSVCDLQTMELEKASTNLKNVEISIVTANMPFVVDAFKTQHKINNINLLSTFNSDVFGKKYGIQVVAGELTGVLARSVFVVDKNGKIIYKEVTSNIDKMPNLKEAINVAEKASKGS
jgi:thiol peroxidase